MVLLEVSKFIPEFTYSAFRPFTNSKERITKIERIRDSRYIYRNELEKAFFSSDIAYGTFEDLTKHYVTKHLQLVVVQSMMNINVGLHRRSKKFLTENLKILLVTEEQESFLRINNQPMN